MTTTTTTTTQAPPTTQVFRIHIKATPQAIWDAITSPDWTERYGYRTREEFDLRPGGGYRAYANDGMKAMGTPDVVAEGEIVESDPPRRLVQTWRMLFDADMAAEPFTRVTYEIEETPSGHCRLTVTHDMDGAPIHAALVGGDQFPAAGGGRPFILSDLKTLLETGQSL